VSQGPESLLSMKAVMGDEVVMGVSIALIVMSNGVGCLICGFTSLNCIFFWLY
jgi:hypothetical protein